jgi:SP family sugar:H+ symporter-like MFS transporter
MLFLICILLCSRNEGSLEDINEMFDKEVPTRQFRNYVLEHKTEGKAEIIEVEKAKVDKPADIHVL